MDLFLSLVDGRRAHVYVRSCEKVGGTLVTAGDVLYKKSRDTVPTVHLKDYEG